MLNTFTDKMERDYLEMGQDWEFAKGTYLLRTALSYHDEWLTVSRP
jgi:hypothetical protein